jgi:alkyl hydroperoxide reductase subunit F
MLTEDLKLQLKSYLERVLFPFELKATLDHTEKSQELKQLLSQISTLSDKITLRFEDQSADQKSPSFSISRIGTEMKLRFAAIPLGHEFSSLVLALLWAGGHPPKVEASILEQIKALDKELYFEIFMSLSCHNCPDVVQALSLLAIYNPKISTVVIDGALFQEEVEQRRVMAVPTVFLNGELFGSGRMTLEEILAKIDHQQAQKNQQLLNQKPSFDMLVIGGGPAGAAAAIYAARKGIKTGMVTERIGGQTNDTMGIENYISVLSTDGPKFSMALEAHVKAYDVDVMNLQAVSRVIPGAEKGDLIQVELAQGAILKTKTLILATGAKWRNINVPGENEYKNKGVAYCPHCDGPLYKGKRTAVIGGGNSGVEAAIDLAGIVEHVFLIEYHHQLKADAILVDKLESLKNVTIITNAQTLAILGDGQRVNALTYRDRTSLVEKNIEIAGIFVQIGLLPNTEFLKSTIELNRFGEIVIDHQCHTNVEGIFAAGDATIVPFKQIVIAAGEGAKAALSAFDYMIRTTFKSESS